MTRTIPVRGRRRPALALALAAAALSLAACAGSGSSSGSAASEAPAAGAPAPGVRDGSADQGTDSAGGSPLAVSEDRSIVVRADMTVRVDDLAPATDRLGGIAARYRATIASQTTSSGGGYAVEPSYDANGQQVCPASGCPTSYASSTTTLRVSNDDVDALIGELGKLGVVLTSYRTTDDVTAEVADVSARVANAEASLARVRALMEKATSLTDVVALEAELSRRQGDLEALQARQRVLADQTAQATVTVRLVAEDAPAPEEPRTGFVAGLQAGWEAFTGAAVLALTVLGAMLPFLVVLAPLGLLVWWLVRRAGRRASPPTDQA